MTNLIVTLGPSTNREEDLVAMKEAGVTYVRSNMSHTPIPDLKRLILLAKKVGIPFILDTEGPQVRTGKLASRTVALREGDKVKILSEDVVGDDKKFPLRPKEIVGLLHNGDQLHFDGSLLLTVSDVSTNKDGYVTATVSCPGRVGENKGVAIDSIHASEYNLPALSKKDIECIKIGLDLGINTIACSFMRSGRDVLDVRKATDGKMNIILKIECQSALDNLDNILEETDEIIIDRHDLCKEIPKQKIFHTQKQIFDKASQKGKRAYASSYMLESMVDEDKPTEYEMHNVINTILHGAGGLILSAETTVGAHPHKAIAMLKKLIEKAHQELGATISR